MPKYNCISTIICTAVTKPLLSFPHCFFLWNCCIFQTVLPYSNQTFDATFWKLIKQRKKGKKVVKGNRGTTRQTTFFCKTQHYIRSSAEACVWQLSVSSTAGHVYSSLWDHHLVRLWLTSLLDIMKKIIFSNAEASNILQICWRHVCHLRSRSWSRWISDQTQLPSSIPQIHLWKRKREMPTVS